MDATVITKPARKVLNVRLKRCGAVIVAGGNASRMGGIDKIMAQLHGEAVIRRTVRNFQECDAVSEIVIVTRPDLIEGVMGLCRDFSKVTAVLAGGSSRQESVRNGLNALSARVKLAAVHDGARPFSDWQLIDRVIRAANTYGAAAPGIPVKDTVKVVTGGIVQQTPDRASLRAIQTPQVFDIDLLWGAHAWVEKQGLAVTDDCAAVEQMGMSVKIVEGDERNIKITTPMDLKIANMLLEENE